MRTLERWHKFLFLRLVEQHFPPRLQNDLKNLPWPDSLPNPIESSFIYGPTNHGKTVYAAFMLLQEDQNNYIELNVEPKKYFFVSVPEFFQTIRESFNKEERDHQYLNNLCTCDFLILDDIGIKNPGDWGMELLYLLINYRYEHLKKTVITCNLDLPELSNLFGDDRIVSRIQRMCKILKKSDWNPTANHILSKK